MRFSKHSRFIKVICVGFSLILCLFALVGCESRPLSPSKQSLKTVGTVGEYEVSYEELYFLASNYKTEDMSADDLWKIVSENIISNYAILSLCDRYSVSIDEAELEDNVQAYIDRVITEDFGGKRSNYINALEESHMTDHYVRFTARTDILYENLYSYMANNGDIETDQEKVVEHIKNNFIRTWHFMIANNSGDDASKNFENAQNALSDLKSGKTTMYKLIGGALNEDLLIPSDGYTFTHGSMEKQYEDAAFALNIGEYSDVVEAKGELASGEYVDCYYVIQRLSLDEDYILDNYADLYDTYESSVVFQKLEQINAELEFTPNEYALSLDICNLKPITPGTDTFLITILCIIGVAVVAIIVTVVIVVICFKKKKEKMIAEAKLKKSLRSGKQ